MHWRYRLSKILPARVPESVSKYAALLPVMLLSDAHQTQASAIRMIEQLDPPRDKQAPSIHNMIRTLHAQVTSRVQQKSMQPSQLPNQCFTNQPSATARQSLSELTQPGSDCPETWDSTGLDLNVFEDPWNLNDIDLDAFAITFDLPS
jgi:hypothetical protein